MGSVPMFPHVSKRPRLAYFEAPRDRLRTITTTMSSSHASGHDIQSLVEHLRSFCNSTTEINTFEQFLYSTTTIEDLLGPDMYLDLISLDFRNASGVRKGQKALREWLSMHFPADEAANTSAFDAHALTLDIAQQHRTHLETEIKRRKRALEDLRVKCEQALEDKDVAVQKIFSEQSSGCPWLARSLSEYQTLADFQYADILGHKKHPAVKTAEALRAIARKKRDLLTKVRILRTRIEYYEKMFPWLSDYVDVDIDTLLGFVSAEGEEPDKDPVRRYLSKGEFARLTPKIRNQMALDRYWASRKQPWQLGRDYERYVGYLYENDAYHVQYFGIEEGLGDLGRDLICRKDDEHLVIQCKYWASFRTIHEKHIAQLLGTFEMYKLENNVSRKANAQAVFVTSTSLTDKALEFAKYLGIHVRQNLAFENYPCIKCNTFSTTGEKIYHLPMDQQYDRIVMNKNAGRFYIDTVEKAEARGFRRAWRWRPSQEHDNGVRS